MTIKYKIQDVPDGVCKDGPCQQLWEGECRAFAQPHSREEYLHRSSDKMKVNCVRLEVNPKRKFDGFDWWTVVIAAAVIVSLFTLLR